MKTPLSHLRLLAASVMTIALAGCGGGSSSNISIGGKVTGLTGNLMLSNNLSNNINLSAGASSYAFSNRIQPGEAYSVTVQQQPENQTCTVANASGIAGTTDINNIDVSCVPNHSLGGTISGLKTDIVLVNGSDTVSVAAGSTSFTFPRRVGENASYGVTILPSQQQGGQTCTVDNGTGMMGPKDVTNVQVSCI